MIWVNNCDEIEICVNHFGRKNIWMSFVFAFIICCVHARVYVWKEVWNERLQGTKCVHACVKLLYGCTCVCVCVCVCVCMREREGVSDRLLREWRCFWQRLLVVQHSANAFFYLDSRGCVACNPQSWKRNAKHSHPTPQQIKIFWVYSTMTCYKQVQIFKLDSKFHRRWSPVKGAHRIKYDNFSHSCSTPQPPMQPNPLLSSNLCSNKP